MTDSDQPETLARLVRQVEALQTRASGLEIHNQWYLDRIRRLEREIGARGRGRAILAAPASSLVASDRDRDGGTRATAHQSSTQAARAVRSLERQIASLEAVLRQKELIISDLNEEAERRLLLVEESRAETLRLYEAVAVLTAAAQEKDLAITRFSHDLQQKDDLIVEIAGIAQVRLDLVDAASAETSQLYDAVGRLTDDLQQKDLIIAELALAAEERLALVKRAAVEMSALHEAIRVLTDELQQKDRAIAELAQAAEERLALVDRLGAEIGRLRESLTGLAEEAGGAQTAPAADDEVGPRGHEHDSSQVTSSDR